MPTDAQPVAQPTTVLVLRTCTKDMHGICADSAHFTWPESGPVEAPDWKPTKECGNGLHGLLWGEGNGNTFSWEPDAKWLVVEVAAADIVDLDRKVKFPRGTVVHCGDRKSATEYLAERAPGRAIVGGTATAGNRGTATAGNRGTATAGDDGTATAGDDGILNLRWWDGRRYRIATFYVGEDGILPNQPYKVNGKGRPVKIDKKTAKEAA